MNVGRYLRGEDRHVGTARTTQPQPPQRTEQEPVAHPERHELQAKGEHPAPCARFCEANAFKIVIKNLKAQLAQPEQEPVAWMFQHEETGRTMCVDSQQVEWGFEKGNPRLKKIAPLYTTPPQRKPLTDEEISDLWDGHVVPVFGKNGINPIVFARAIEQAHNIKE